eukprot:439640_1
MSTDSVLMVWYFIRQEYENIYDKDIANPLKHLVAQYADKIIGCKMLTFKEDIQLFQLLSSELKDNSCYKQFKLLYRASENNYSSKAFHAKCDRHSNTITIIQSNFGNIFGGYLSIPWPDTYFTKNNSDQYFDDKSFLFILRSKINILNNSRIECNGVSYVCTRGPIFGVPYQKRLLQVG